MLSDVTPQHFTVAGLHAAIADSVDMLASPEGPLVKPLFPHDPTGELMNLLDAAGSAPAPQRTQGVWSSRDGARALLLVQTRSAGSDTDAQQRAGALRAAFSAALADLPASAPPRALC